MPVIISSCRPCHLLVMHGKWRKNPSVGFQGSDADRRRPCGTRISRSSRLQQLPLRLMPRPLERRGICRRKFPVAKIHDLYIGIDHQRLNSLIAFRRRDGLRRLSATICGHDVRRATAQRNAYSVHNLSLRAGMRNGNALQSDACLNLHFVDVTSGSGTSYLTVSSE